MSTGEFRAAPDISASTAQFQAFAENRAGQPGPAGQAETAAPARNPARLAALIAAAVIVVLILVIVIAKVA